MLKAYLPALVFLALGIGVGVAFTLLNAALLTVRIRVENAALRTLPGGFVDA